MSRDTDTAHVPSDGTARVSRDDTARGHDAQEGAARIPGVRRPGPGAA